MKRFFIILGVIALVVAFAVADDDSPRGPVIVFKKVLTNQSASISATTLYTPTVDGDYLVSGYLVANGCCNGGSAELDVHWTDEFAARTSGYGTVVGGASNAVSGSVVMHVTSGNPITFSTIYNTSSSEPNISYDLFITVVKE